MEEEVETLSRYITMWVETSRKKGNSREKNRATRNNNGITPKKCAISRLDPDMLTTAAIAENWETARDPETEAKQFQETLGRVCDWGG